METTSYQITTLGPRYKQDPESSTSKLSTIKEMSHDAEEVPTYQMKHYPPHATEGVKYSFSPQGPDYSSIGRRFYSEVDQFGNAHDLPIKKLDKYINAYGPQYAPKEINSELLKSSPLEVEKLGINPKKIKKAFNQLARLVGSSFRDSNLNKITESQAQKLLKSNEFVIHVSPLIVGNPLSAAIKFLSFTGEANYNILQSMQPFNQRLYPIDPLVLSTRGYTDEDIYRMGLAFKKDTKEKLIQLMPPMPATL